MKAPEKKEERGQVPGRGQGWGLLASSYGVLRDWEDSRTQDVEGNATSHTHTRTERESEKESGSTRRRATHTHTHPVSGVAECDGGRGAAPVPVSEVRSGRPDVWMGPKSRGESLLNSTFFEFIMIFFFFFGLATI